MNLNLLITTHFFKNTLKETINHLYDNYDNKDGYEIMTRNGG